MTYRNNFLLTCMVALCAVGAESAAASPMYVTYTGTASGTDTNGVFGTAGTVLQSVNFTATYTYDPALFGNASVTQTSYRNYVQGGTEYGNTDPMLSAQITVNGTTFSQGSSYSGNAGVATSGSGFAAVFDEAYSSSANYLDLYTDYVSSPVVIPSLTAVQSFTGGFSGTAYGFFDYNGQTISLYVSSISVTNVSPLPPTAVPEPGTPALLGGVALSFILGAGRWRRVLPRT